MANQQIQVEQLLIIPIHTVSHWYLQIQRITTFTRLIQSIWRLSIKMRQNGPKSWFMILKLKKPYKLRLIIQGLRLLFGYK